MRVSTVLEAIVLVLIVMNEAISACMFLKVEGSYMRVSTVLGATVLVLIIMNEAISACRFLTVEGSYMRVSTVFVVSLSFVRDCSNIILGSLSILEYLQMKTVGFYCD